jgi:cell division septation protein DedD
MEHKMVTFRLHRTAVIFIIIGLILAAVLIFGGGYIVGGRRRPSLPVVAVTAATAATALSTATTTSAAAPDGELLTVRVGVYDSEEEAKTLVQQLTARKLAAAVVPLTTTDGVNLYTVQVGQYATRVEATAAAASLAEEPGLHPAVVPVGR